MSITSLVPVASEKQAAFITTLLADRTGYTEGFAQRVARAIADETLPRKKASEIIDFLLAKPRKEADPDAPVDGLDLRPLEAITSQGIVRLAVPGGDTRLKVRIKFAKDGTVYVDDAAEYGSRSCYGTQRPGQPYRGKIADALTAILADPRAAAVRYCELTDTCAVCGRALEAEDSVAAGIGPVCRGKLGL